MGSVTTLYKRIRGIVANAFIIGDPGGSGRPILADIDTVKNLLDVVDIENDQIIIGSKQFNQQIIAAKSAIHKSIVSTPIGINQSQNIDWSVSGVQTLDLTSASGTVTITFTNPCSTTFSCQLTLKIIQPATPVTIIWPTITWDDGSAVSWETASKKRWAYLIYDGTENIYYGSPSETFS